MGDVLTAGFTDNGADQSANNIAAFFEQFNEAFAFISAEIESFRHSVKATAMLINIPASFISLTANSNFSPDSFSYEPQCNNKIPYPQELLLNLPRLQENIRKPEMHGGDFRALIEYNIDKKIPYFLEHLENLLSQIKERAALIADNEFGIADIVATDITQGIENKSEDITELYEAFDAIKNYVAERKEADIDFRKATCFSRTPHKAVTWHIPDMHGQFTADDSMRHYFGITNADAANPEPAP